MGNRNRRDNKVPRSSRYGMALRAMPIIGKMRRANDGGVVPPRGRSPGSASLTSESDKER